MPITEEQEAQIDLYIAHFHPSAFNPCGCERGVPDGAKCKFARLTDPITGRIIPRRKKKT